MRSKREGNSENGGRRLLKKGRRGLLHAVFSRAGLIGLFLLLQVALIIVGFSALDDYLPHYFTASVLFSTVMALFLLNSSQDASAKLTWVIVIMALPAFGALLYLYTRSDLGHRLLKGRFAELTEECRGRIPQSEEVMERLRREAPEAAGLVSYVNRTGCYPIFDRCSVRYFPSGEEMFPALLEQLEAAEKFIFLEFFVVAEGQMWDAMLEILKRKAAAGVDVRLIYDGTCEFFTLPRSYPKRMGEYGIRCKAFAPITPFVSTYYNYRDHRKILIVDGHTVFTGGMNLADEYINVLPRFGYWKDSAVRIRGEAVRSFTLMFLQMWNIDRRETDFSPDCLDAPAPAQEGASGFVMPYGDCPLDEERVGEWVYMDLLNRARRSVWIMSPYLILDGEMETAIRFAAERGVDVRLILPGIPDKKLPYALAKTHYAALLRSGVKLYEYVPGFVHAKVLLSDEREAVVGTINLDYRSLYHHFECAAYLHGTDCIREIREDFLRVQQSCRAVTEETIRAEKWTVRLAGALMKVIAPLM